MATLLSDNFDRANSTSVLGSPQIGPAPTVVAGTMGVISNQGYASAVPGMAVYNLGTADVELSIFCGSITSANTLSIILGYVSLTDFYQILAATNGVVLYKSSAGGFAPLYSSTVNLPISGASTLRAHYKDGIIRAYVDDVLVIRYVLDEPITSTSHGFRASGSTTVRADNLLGTDAPTISEPTLAGSTQTTAFVYTSASEVATPSFAYRGGDTKLQDISEGA